MTTAELGPLRITVTFPLGYYAGAEQGAAEDLPAPARLHEAFVAAASGGPWSRRDDRVLVPLDEHRVALEWLEGHEPIGLIPPRTDLKVHRIRHYRRRMNPDRSDPTEVETRAAVSGPVTYLWPEPEPSVLHALQAIAPEVAYVGRSDSVAIVRVFARPLSEAERSRMHECTRSRGPGRILRVPLRGRTRALLDAHRNASVPRGYPKGQPRGQVPDLLVTGANEMATTVRRFAMPRVRLSWPFEEAWVLPVRESSGLREHLLHPANRVPAALGVHRAIVRAIGTDVPPLVTGRDLHGPLRGPGHLAIHIVEDPQSGDPRVVLGIPSGVTDADRELLRGVLARPLRAATALERGRVRWFTLLRPQVRSALPYWSTRSPIMRTAVPLVLDAWGSPRRGRWSLEDAVVCSIGYALRGPLEEQRFEWGTGWGFRVRLVETLRREFGVRAVVRRVHGPASRYVYRANPGDLVVAVHAAVNLGELAPAPGGLLALGRARHLGGGLLVPFEGAVR